MVEQNLSQMMFLPISARDSIHSKHPLHDSYAIEPLQLAHLRRPRLSQSEQEISPTIVDTSQSNVPLGSWLKTVYLLLAVRNDGALAQWRIASQP